jgi:GH25 family lysozyme M1 (1,4-beta-N-acetylmuramidase)
MRKLSIGMAVLALTAGLCAALPAEAATAPSGVDVASYQTGLNWDDAVNHGVSFAYVKATEGTGYVNAAFAELYNGSYQHKMIRGAYHYARPDGATGAAQAEYFVRHGGGWSKDGRTLPGALDLENHPDVAYCYNRTPLQIRTWVHDFVRRYHELTGRWAVIYTRTNWWDPCTGKDASLAANSPLWLSHVGAAPGPMPAGWRTQSFWQPGSLTLLVRSKPAAVDHDVWNGSADRLRALACDGPC